MSQVLQGVLVTALPTILRGVAVAVDLDIGVLTLVHGDGTRCRLGAPPFLLQTVRLGAPVRVVVEGPTIRAIRCG